MTNLVGALPFIILSLFTGVVVVYYLRNKHHEKLEIIRQGDNPVYQDALEKMKFANLGRAIIFIFLGIAIFLSHLMVQILKLEAVVTYLAMILLFFGIGSLIFYFIIRNK